MAIPKTDDEYAARQILAVFARYIVAVAGVLRRHQFFEVRDSDFQRGIEMLADVRAGSIGSIMTEEADDEENLILEGEQTETILIVEDAMTAIFEHMSVAS